MTSVVRGALLGVVCLALSPLRADPAPPADGVLRTIRYAGEGSLKEDFGDFHFLIDAVTVSEDLRVPRLRVSLGGKPAFTIRFDTPAGDNASATVKVVTLGAGGPQVVFQRFTHGAHCCVESKIAIPHDGAWTVINGDLLDGDVGYEFKDIDGDGDEELVGADESFVEAFSDDANSFAPIRIQKLDGTRLADVTADPRFRGAVARRLAILEDDDQNGAQWDNNGFLAAWVATKILLGEGDAAWSKMLQTYDKDPAVPLEMCEDPVPLRRCREDRKRPAAFPEALRAHLIAHGYIKDGSAFQLEAKPKGTSE